MKRAVGHELTMTIVISEPSTFITLAFSAAIAGVTGVTSTMRTSMVTNGTMPLPDAV